MSANEGAATAAGLPASSRPRPGDRLELRVDALAHGGAGIGRHDGYVVFVDGAFPGDVVSAEIVKPKRGYATARLVEVLEPSSDRVPERCDHDGPGCPGSPWQGLRYERQLEHKQQQVDDALTRLGGLSGYAIEPIVAATECWRYRNKMEYSFGSSADSFGGSAGTPAETPNVNMPSAADPADGFAAGRRPLVLGFHSRGRWEQVLDARDCVLASERSNAVRNFVRDWCRERDLPAYDRRDGSGLLRNLVVREGRRTGELQVRLVTTDGEVDVDRLATELADRFPDASLLWTRTAAMAEVSYGGETDLVAGASKIREELAGLRFEISPHAFFQTNTEMAERLYGLAADYASLGGQERVFDLYCGIGTLSLVLALRAAEVWAVDVVEEAIADAIENARANEIENVRFFAGDTRTAIRPLAQQAPRPDVVVVDPPRAGLSAKVVRRLLETNPRRIVYVSCNPTTLAPNARQIVDAGFRLVKVRPVDMFPHTPHIECVALLERVDG
jgi:23S rRNA (uracil1939-C5)-methyltransferase